MLLSGDPTAWTKTAAWSQYPRPSDEPTVSSDLPSYVTRDHGRIPHTAHVSSVSAQSQCILPIRRCVNITIMGYSMRLATLRFTEWVGFRCAVTASKLIASQADWSDVHATELYLHNSTARRRCLRDSQPRRRSPVLRAGATSSRKTPCRVARRKRATVVTTLRFGLRDQKYGDDIAHLIHCPPTPTPWCLKHANLLALVCSSRPYRPARRTRNIHHPAHHRFRWHRQSQGSIRAKLAAQVPAGSPRIQLGRGVSYLHEDDRVAHIDDAPKPIHMSLSYMYQSTHLHCQDSTYQPCASARHAGLRAGFRVPLYATTSVEFEPRR
jgi:hypothetical protein